MIASLSIENFALIERLSVDFKPGFSIITGETGAGKSILLDALGLVLGQRADLSALFNKEQKCVVEAQFHLDGYQLEPFFQALDWDFDLQTIIRREILPGGKSRAFVNDTPVNLADLQQLAVRLIDVHSQHQTAEITDAGFQLAMLDAVAGHQETLADYTRILSEYKKLNTQLTAARDKKSAAIKESDYLSFLLEELTAAQLIDGEQETLEAEFEKGSNVEAIRQHLDKGLSLLHDDQYGILTLLREFKGAMQKMSALTQEFQPLADRAQSALIELDDLAAELAASADSLEVDPERLEEVSQKLQLIYALQKKHQVQTVAQLLAIRDDLDAQTVSMASLDDEIARLEQDVEAFHEKLSAMAKILSDGRRAAIPRLTDSLAEVLSQLGMPHVRVKIDLTPSADFTPTGTDVISFLFSANKGAEFGPLKKVASGGERSRIMLAVKYILAKHSTLPTIIFDEIDTGVSGEMADAMGNIMKSMSSSMQVFAITHLPQIAAKGDQHFKVSKRTDGARTTSTLTLLDKESRIAEIAQMLSGSAVSDSAINHARALLN